MVRPDESLATIRAARNTAGMESQIVTSDLILALHRSPTLRHILRKQPLPGDIDLVMRLAAASQPLLDDTAERLSVDAATLLEAARFYLQQVLLEPGVDAYRILGTTPDAPLARIHEHYRLLQRWLHPDRRNAEGESPFAARLNWARQQLRNENARVAYDAMRVRQLPATGAGKPASTARSGEWTTTPVPASARPGYWWRRGVIGMAFGSCLMLFYLALTHRDLPTNSPTSPPEAAQTEFDAAPTVALSSAADVSTTTTPTGAQDDRVSSTQVMSPKALSKGKQAAADASPSDHSEPFASVEAAGAAIRALDPSRSAAPPMRPALVVVKVALPPIEPPRSLSVFALQIDKPLAAVANRHSITFRPPSTAAAAPERTRQVPTKASAVATSSPTEPVADSVLLQRVAMARERVRSLVEYFHRADSNAPSWSDAQPPFNAPLQRAALRQRNGLHAAADFVLDTPVWRMTEDRIAMDANYLVERVRNYPEHGRFHVRMIWQGDDWQITRIELEPRR